MLYYKLIGELGGASTKELDMHFKREISKTKSASIGYKKLNFPLVIPAITAVAGALALCK